QPYILVELLRNGLAAALAEQEAVERPLVPAVEGLEGPRIAGRVAHHQLLVHGGRRRLTPRHPGGRGGCGIHRGRAAHVPTHRTNEEGAEAPSGFLSIAGRQVVCVAAFMLRRIRPCLSTSSTLTRTMSPSLSLSLTLSTRSSQICEICTRPSLPGRMFTK